MSDFILNLVRRGAGLAPVVALQPPFMPGFAPDIGAAHPAEPGSERAPVGEDRPELPVQTQAEATSVQAQLSPAAALSSPIPASADAAPPPSSLVRTSPLPLPVDTESAQEPLPKPAEPAAAQPNTEVSSTAVEPAAPQPQEEVPLTAAEPQSSPPRRTRLPASPSVSMPRAEPTVQMPGDTSKPEPSLPAILPTPSQPAARPQPARDLPTKPKTGPVAMPAAIYPIPTHEMRETSEGETVAQVQPATTPPATARGQAIIKPAPVTQPSPTTLTMVEPAIPRPEPRPIQVRIGTIEVRATTPPISRPPTPAPQGFDDYVQIRTYVNWEI